MIASLFYEAEEEIFELNGEQTLVTGLTNNQIADLFVVNKVDLVDNRLGIFPELNDGLYGVQDFIERLKEL